MFNTIINKLLALVSTDWNRIGRCYSFKWGRDCLPWKSAFKNLFFKSRFITQISLVKQGHILLNANIPNKSIKDFILWRYMKTTIYSTKPYSWDDHDNVIQGITENFFQNIFVDLHNHVTIYWTLTISRRGLCKKKYFTNAFYRLSLACMEKKL